VKMVNAFKEDGFVIRLIFKYINKMEETYCKAVYQKYFRKMIVVMGVMKRNVLNINARKKTSLYVGMVIASLPSGVVTGTLTVRILRMRW